MASLPTSAPGKTRIDEKLSQTSWNFAEVYLASLVHTIFPLVEKKKPQFYLMDYLLKRHHTQHEWNAT